nr:hypothetical protein [Mycoplasmopsis bovis]
MFSLLSGSVRSTSGLLGSNVSDGAIGFFAGGFWLFILLFSSLWHLAAYSDTH